MAKTYGGIRVSSPGNGRDYYNESKRLRNEAMTMAENLKGSPLSFKTNNGIEMNVVVTKSDIKTIVSKSTSDNKFNAIKNKLAQDIKGFIEKGKYEGTRDVIKGKHPETAYFAYYSRRLGAKAYLAMRKMNSTGEFKPYAIINEKMFLAEAGKLKKK